MENRGCSQSIIFCLSYFFFLTVFSAPRVLGRGQQLLPVHVCYTVFGPRKSDLYARVWAAFEEGTRSIVREMPLPVLQEPDYD